MREVTLAAVHKTLQSRPRKQFTRAEVTAALGVPDTLEMRSQIIWALCRLVDLKQAKEGTPAGPYRDSTWKAAAEK